MTELHGPTGSSMDQVFQSTGSHYSVAKEFGPKQRPELSIKETTFSNQSDDENKTDNDDDNDDGDADDDDDDDDDGSDSDFRQNFEEGTPAYEEEETHRSYEELEPDEDEESLIGSASAIYSKLSPFAIKWSFGVKTAVKLINLTTTSAPEIFFAASHFGVIYNYRLDKMEFLPGHNYTVQSISADASGRWLVTADCGDDSVVIIWDHQKRLPVWCMYKVFPQGVRYLKISPDARFLIAINCGSQNLVKFWQWTLGNEEPDGTMELDPNYGPAKHIAYNQLRTEQFAITARYKILFCEWSNDGGINMFPAPFEYSAKKIGVFRESIFLDDNHTVITATSTGYILLWCDVEYSQPIRENTKGTIEKNHVKTIRIHKAGITCMRLSDKYLITSSEDGHIYFHDQHLRLMYLVPQLQLDPIVCVSFNLADSSLDPFAPGDENPYKSQKDDAAAAASAASDDGQSQEKPQHFKEESEEDDHLKTRGKHHHLSIIEALPRPLPFENKLKHIPSDCTIEMRPFLVRDFVFLTKTGKMGYLSHQRRKVKYFLYNTDGPAIAIGCNPNKNHLLVSYATGRLVLYHYITKKIIGSVSMPGMRITTIAYSHMGHFLAVGTDTGKVLLLNPFLLTVENTFVGGKAPIQKISLSRRDDIIACYDQLSTVYIFVHQLMFGKKKWVSMGKCISHYKPINDILFEEKASDPSKVPRLFTIGQDRMLVEYDTAKLEPNKLKLKKIHRIEQTAVPLCFIWHPPFHRPNDFLLSNSEFKLKVVDSFTQVCQKTTLGPTADTPITQMKIVPEPTRSPASKTVKMLYATQKQIGIKFLPSTGNPFESIGMVAHPVKIIAQVHSHDYRYVFTAGLNDQSVLMWEVNLAAVEVASQIGGEGLEPFLSLIEGGGNSFFFREIEDFFYYAQIIHQGEDPNSDRSVSKNLALCEIPDLFRSLGYFLTDCEIDNLIYELKHLKFDQTGETVGEVSFEECVKAFLNHKPVQGISLNLINNALMSIADLSDPTDILVERSELYKALETRAEAMDHKEVLGYLCILLLPKDENNPVPATLSLHDFATNLLGIDLTISEEQVKQITHPFEYRKHEGATDK